MKPDLTFVPLACGESGEQELISMLGCLILTQSLLRNTLCLLCTPVWNSWKDVHLSNAFARSNRSFTSLHFEATVGTGKADDVMYRRLAYLLSAKWNKPYISIISWLRCQISFSLLRSAIVCIRSSRSSSNFVPPNLNVAVRVTKLHIDPQLYLGSCIHVPVCR